MNWNYVYTPDLWPALFTVFLLALLSVYGWRRRNVPGALPFTLGCLLTLPWAVSIVMEYTAVEVVTKIFWSKFQTVWQLPATTAITCFILEYTWPGRWLTRRNLIWLAVVPLLALVFFLTNDFHHLIWLDFTFNGSVVPQHGPLAWIFMVYSFAWAVINLGVLSWLFLRSPQHRWPVAIMLFSQIGARVLFLLDFANLDAWFFSIPEFAFPFTAYAVALFGFRIFDPILLARQTVIEQLHEGMLVLDAQGRVVSLNPAAERMLQVRARVVQGRAIHELLPAYTAGMLEDDRPAVVGFGWGAGSAVRSYSLEILPLKDWRGLEVGRVLLLRDVTESKRVLERQQQQQQQLVMLNEREWLARELHDNLGQVFAFVNTQGQAVRHLLAKGEVALADQYIGRLVEVAREADVDIRESILGLRVSLSGREFFQALAQYLERYERNYGIHTVLVGSETLGSGVFEPQVEVQLLRILQEALTNARKHAAAHCVRVVFTVLQGKAQVAIQDDGRGFDQQELPDGDGFESRVGLRVMRERAMEVGGSLVVRSKPGEGTLILVTLPLRPPQENGLNSEREAYARSVSG